MKTRILIVALLGLSVALSGCKDKAIYKTFQTQYSFRTTVPANSLLSTSLFPINIEEEDNSESQYAINDTRRDLVEEVYIQSFLLEVVSPQSEDLSFLNAATFYIDADGEPEMKIASKDPVPSSVGPDLLFDLEPVNLAPYLRKDPFTIRTNVVTDENRTQDIELRGTIDFEVKAKVLNLD